MTIKFEFLEIDASTDAYEIALLPPITETPIPCVAIVKNCTTKQELFLTKKMLIAWYDRLKAFVDSSSGSRSTEYPRGHNIEILPGEICITDYYSKEIIPDLMLSTDWAGVFEMEAIQWKTISAEAKYVGLIHKEHAVQIVKQLEPAINVFANS